jgi:acyl-coenzyme A synthetase/AMP-(fatty) acid ligase
LYLQRIGNRGIGLGTLFERGAARHPDNQLVLDHDLGVAPNLGRRLPIGTVSELVADLASRLWAAGVRPGDRVAVYKSDSFDITLLACAAARIAAVPMLLSASLTGATVQELIRRAASSFLITDKTKLDEELTDSVFALVKQVLLTSGDHPSATTLQSLAGCPRVEPVQASPDSPTLITHTSGTTGTPKLAVHTSRSLQARYRPQATAVAPLLRKGETVVIHVSFVHSRLFTALAISLLRGFRILVLVDGDLDKAAELFTQFQPTVIEAHPNSFLAWEAMAADPRRPLARVKLFSSTFDAIHPRTVRRLLSATSRRAPLFGQLYGQSEVGPAVVRAFTRRHAESADGRCVGMPFPGMTKVRVVSRNGKPPSAANPGYIEVRSDGRVKTYLGEEARYLEQVSDGGWWRMGDVGYRTKQGCVHLLDREVDLIEGFGSTLAVEDALFNRLDDLVEVVIVAGPDGTAVPVVSVAGDKALDLRRWKQVTADLPPMADPVQWRLEDLPHTATIKVKRLELGRRLAARSG